MTRKKLRLTIIYERFMRTLKAIFVKENFRYETSISFGSFCGRFEYNFL